MKYVLVLCGLGGSYLAAEWLFRRAFERGEARKRTVGLR